MTDAEFWLSFSKHKKCYVLKVRFSAYILVLDVHISYFPYTCWQPVRITVLFRMPKEYDCTDGGTYFD